MTDIAAWSSFSNSARAASAPRKESYAAALAACLNNMGPGLGIVAANYADLSDVSKSILTAVMVLGRLEIFTLLVLLTPEFWKG